MLIDIRAFAAFAKSRLEDAINVCIPTVLLKRSSLSLDDILESIVARGDRGRFARWKEVDGIVIYDADSLRVKDSYPLATLATKFIEAGFTGATYGLIGSPSSLGKTADGRWVCIFDRNTLVNRFLAIDKLEIPSDIPVCTTLPPQLCRNTIRRRRRNKSSRSRM